MKGINRHSDEYWQKRRLEKLIRTAPKPRTFIAVDGEGIETEEVQIYSILSSSIHNPIIKKEGLSTEECLRFLLDLSATGVTVVGYGFNYDVNMILKDLDKERLIALYERETCWLPGQASDYRIERVKGKTLRVSEYSKRKVYHQASTRLRSVTIWDVLGFFQGPFLKAVEEWRIPLSSKQREILERGKERRGEFQWDDLIDIIDYNHLECDLLVLLMNEVQAMLRKQSLYLSRWDGAGSIATSLMKKYGVNKYVNRGFNSDVEEAIMRAYFGGRSQCVQFGLFSGPIYHYDINSSYPSSYLDLPTLHGKWHYTDSYLPDQSYALYEVEWDIPEEYPIIPFPYRGKDGGIRYPNKGRGIYHSTLVAAAQTRLSKYIHILKGWVFTPESDEKPFAFVRPFMEERLRLKREGDLRHITMKLGANSIYGKTAQSVSYGDEVPPYQSYYWAGRITSWTHEQLLKASFLSPNNIIFFGTDSIFSRIPLEVPIGTELGTWEDCNDEGPLEEFELYQPGLYRMKWNDESQVRTRGFHTSEIDFDVLRQLWKEKTYGGCYKTRVVRFQGLEICTAQNNLSQWRQWKAINKDLHLRPSGFGIVSDPGKNSYHGWSYQDSYRYRYVDGGTELSYPFEKAKMRLPDPNNHLQLTKFCLDAEWADDQSLD